MRNPLMLIAIAACLAGPISLPAEAQTNSAPGRRNVAEAPAQEEPTPPSKEFNFPGGQLGEFMLQLKSVFGLDLEQTVPGAFWGQIRVPRMKLKTAYSAEVLELYNQIAQADRTMGRWYVVYSGMRGRVGGGGGGGGVDAGSFGAGLGGRPVNRPLEPNSIVFIPPSANDSSEPAVSVKAYTLAGMSDSDRDRLMKGIEAASRSLTGGDSAPIKRDRNSIFINKETEILVVTGSKSYVELVSGMVEAFREGLRVSPRYPLPPKAENK